MAKRKRKRPISNKSSRKKNKKRKKQKLQVSKQCNGITTKSTKCKRKIGQSEMYCYLHLNQQCTFEYVQGFEDAEHPLSINEFDTIYQFYQEFLLEWHLWFWENGWALKHRLIFPKSKELDQHGIAKGHKLYLDKIKNNQWLHLQLLHKPIYPSLSCEYFVKKYYRDLIEIDKKTYGDEISVGSHNFFFIYDIYESKTDENCIIFKWNDGQKQFPFVDPNVGFIQQQNDFLNKRGGWYHGIKQCDYNNNNWEIYSFIKLSLKVKISENNKYIAPMIEEIKEKEVIDRIVSKHVFRTYTSISKLSILLFEIINKYDSIDDFEAKNADYFKQCFWEKLKSRSHKYVGPYPGLRDIYNREDHLIKLANQERNNQERNKSSCLIL